MTSNRDIESVDSGRSTYVDYIKEQLEAQEVRKVSLEQRGIAVVSTSGVLVTLLFGLTALTVEPNSGFVIPHVSTVLLVIALVFFIAAALSAIVTNLPLAYEGVTVDALRGAVKERWDDTEEVASRMTSLTRLTVLESAKKKNNIKGWALFGAMLCEIIAIGLVGAAIGFVLWE